MNWEWIAGFYEGEGHVGKYLHKSPTGSSVVLHLSISQAERSVLNRIKKFVGRGKVYPIKKQARHHRKAWVYQLYGEDAQVFAAFIRPHMQSKRKISQLEKSL